MLAPGHNDFEPKLLPAYLEKLIQSDAAKDTILVLDTAKKFTDLMRKDKVSEFSEILRRFVSRGGSDILLAHVNKYRDADNKVIYSGVSDLVNDADCAYTLDIVNEDSATGLRTVKFENFKNRGDVSKEEFYRYDARPSTLYYDRLESVEASRRQ